KLHRDELVERRLDHRDGGVGGHVDMTEGREEAGRKLRVLAKHLDDGIVLQGRHGARALSHTRCQDVDRERIGGFGDAGVAPPAWGWRPPVIETAALHGLGRRLSRPTMPSPRSSASSEAEPDSAGYRG